MNDGRFRLSTHTLGVHPSFDVGVCRVTMDAKYGRRSGCGADGTTARVLFYLRANKKIRPDALSSGGSGDGKVTQTIT